MKRAREFLFNGVVATAKAHAARLGMGECAVRKAVVRGEGQGDMCSVCRAPLSHCPGTHTARRYDRAAKVAQLKVAAERGLTITAAALEAGVSVSHAWTLGQDHDIKFAPAPPSTTAQAKSFYKELGRRSVASPSHYAFKDEDRRKAARTRKARRS